MGNEKFFLRNIETLLKEKNLSEAEFLKNRLKCQSSLNDWCEGLDFEKINQLIMTADYFEVSLDWLIGLTDERKLSDCRK